MKALLVLGGLLLVLLVPNYAIVQKERLLEEGTVMLLELAPVDPRSLIQGDYMRLDYAVAQGLSGGRTRFDVEPTTPRVPRDGHLVVRLDDGGVARFIRWHTDGTPVAPGEHLLQYRRRGNTIRIATDAFYFQEGHAQRYERAKYGELRVDPSGGSVLVGLRDSLQRPLR